MELDGHLDPDFCNQIIDKFEKDNHKSPGKTGGGYRPDIKDSIDLFINRYQEWDDTVEKLKLYIKDGIEKYTEWLKVILPHIPYDSESLECFNFQIQKSGKYEWHSDWGFDKFGKRIITFIWYLNTKDEGGETDLVYKKVKPRIGKLLMFPATWDYVHRGCPTENKYIITGWFYDSTP